MAAARQGAQVRRSEVLIWNVPSTSGGVALTELSAPETFRPAVSITSLVCSGQLAAFVTSECRVYLMDLRQPPALSDSPRIVQALRGEKVKNVSCGLQHVIALTTGGSVYALEADIGDSSGRGAVLAASGWSTPLPLPTQAMAVSCGAAHVLIATDTGAVFAFGEGKKGQLGLGDNENRKSPMPIHSLAHLRTVSVAAGQMHSCVVTSFGNLFTWGDNQQGQLGDGTSFPKSTPQLISSLESVLSVVASSATAVISSDGSSFAWGFGGRRAPANAFERPVCRLSLSYDVLCAISLDGELLLRALAGPSLRTFLAQRGVAEVAAAGSHVVALGGPRPSLPTPPQSLLQHASFPPKPKSSPTEPVRSSNDTLLAWGEAAELEATNAQLVRTLDEVRAESLFESAQIQRATEAAIKRSNDAWLLLEKERGETSRVGYVVQVKELQEELSSLRAELRAEAESKSGIAISVSDTFDVHNPQSVGVTDAVAKDLCQKHHQLSLEQQRLFEDGEAVQNQISVVRSELTESGQHLKRIEDVCIRTRTMADRQRQMVADFQAEALRAEKELKYAESRLPSVALERSRLEEEAAYHTSQRETLNQHNAQLRKEKDELVTQLAELQYATEGQTTAHWQLMGEARLLTEEHASEEQSLARTQFLCSRLEGEIACLRSENVQVQKQVREMHEAKESSKRNSKSVAEEALHHQLSRTNLYSSGKQRDVHSQVLMDMRERLLSLDAEHQALSGSIHKRTSKFAEETGPLYSEVQRLHTELADLRKPHAIVGNGFGTESTPSAAAQPLHPELRGRPGREPTVVPHLPLNRNQSPSPRMGNVVRPPQTLSGIDAFLSQGRGEPSASQNSMAGTTIGFEGFELGVTPSQLSSQIQETASRREDLMQRLDLNRVGRV